MPLSHASKSKVGASNQIQLYQTMNTSTSLENIQQLVEICGKRISWEHHIEHSRQSSSTTFHGFFNMLGTILQMNHSMVMAFIRPESVGIRRNTFKGRSPLDYSTIFSRRIQANT
jgi:hypothetical protein